MKADEDGSVHSPEMILTSAGESVRFSTVPEATTWPPTVLTSPSVIRTVSGCSARAASRTAVVPVPGGLALHTRF